jgi:hypothetical protein
MVKRIVIFSSVIYSLVPLFLCWFRFCFCSFTLLPPSKSPGSFLSFSPKFPPYLYSPFLFIGAGREGHLTPAMAQGKVATLPMSWHRVGWLVMAWVSISRFTRIDTIHMREWTIAATPHTCDNLYTLINAKKNCKQ